MQMLQPHLLALLPNNTFTASPVSFQHPDKKKKKKSLWMSHFVFGFSSGLPWDASCHFLPFTRVYVMTYIGIKEGTGMNSPLGPNLFVERNSVPCSRLRKHLEKKELPFLFTCIHNTVIQMRKTQQLYRP